MTKRVRIQGQGIPEHTNPVPAAVRIGNQIFSSAIGGHDPVDHSLSEDKPTQFRHCFDNVRRILEKAGATPADIGKMTFYVRDRGDRKYINPEWLKMFPDDDDRPARHTLEANLPDGWHIQVEFIAVV